MRQKKSGPRAEHFIHSTNIYGHTCAWQGGYIIEDQAVPSGRGGLHSDMISAYRPPCQATFPQIFLCHLPNRHLGQAVSYL